MSYLEASKGAYSIGLGILSSGISFTLDVSKDVSKELLGATRRPGGYWGHNLLAGWWSGGYSAKGDADSAAVAVQLYDPVTGLTSEHTDNLTTSAAWNTSWSPSAGGVAFISVTWTWSDGATWTEWRKYGTIGDAGDYDAIVAIQVMELPEVTHLVWETANGELLTDKNPQ